MSAVYMLNSNGPTTDPCGTSCETIVAGAVILVYITTPVPFMKVTLKSTEYRSFHVMTDVQTLNKNAVVDDVECCTEIK